MNIRKVKDVFTDWVRSGFRFGQTFSGYLFARMEASPRTARFGGLAMDVLAGGGLTYLAATSIVGTLAGAAAAITGFTAAPVAALVTLAIAPIWLALSTMTGGIGLGLLDAGRAKLGFGRPTYYKARVKEAVFDRPKGIFSKGGQKLKSGFGKKADKKPSASAADIKTKPSNGEYKL